MASRYDFNIARGETLTGKSFTVRDSAGSLMNLTGCTAHMSVRRKYADTTPTLDLTTANGGLVIDLLASTISPIASHATIYAMDPFNGVYDLFVLFPDNTRFYVVGGLFVVRITATRDP